MEKDVFPNKAVRDLVPCLRDQRISFGLPRSGTKKADVRTRAVREPPLQQVDFSMFSFIKCVIPVCINCLGESAHLQTTTTLAPVL